MQEIENTTKEVAINGNNMLSAFDLRLGNIVFVNNEKHHPEIKNIPMVIKSISRNYWQGEGYIIYCEIEKLVPEKYDWKNYAQNIEFLKAIEISKEWLIKLGFEEIYCSKFTLRYELKKDVRFEISFNLVENYIIARKSGDTLRKVKYIHQIQNLYFTLTGLELICA